MCVCLCVCVCVCFLSCCGFSRENKQGCGQGREGGKKKVSRRDFTTHTLLYTLYDESEGGENLVHTQYVCTYIDMHTQDEWGTSSSNLN